MIGKRSCYVWSCIIFLVVFGLVLFVGLQSTQVMAQTDPGAGDPGTGGTPPPPTDPGAGDPGGDTAPPEPDLGRAVVVSSGVVAIVPEGSSTESIEEIANSAVARTSGRSGGQVFVVFASSDLRASASQTYNERGFVKDYLKPLAKRSPKAAAYVLSSLAQSSPSSFNRLLSQASRSYGFPCKLFREGLSKLAEHGESCKVCRLHKCEKDKKSEEEESIEDTELYNCILALLEEAI